MHLRFLLLQFHYQSADPLDCQSVEAHRNEPAVALNIGFELLTLFAHGLTAWMGGSMQYSQSPNSCRTGIDDER